MMRFSAQKFNKLDLKQSQKLFFSSTQDIPSLQPTSLLKARHDMEIACMNERLDLEKKKFDAEIQKFKNDVDIKKYDAEIKYSLEKQNIHRKYFDEQLNLQLRNVNREQNSNTDVSDSEKDAVLKESQPTVSIPSLFKNEDDIDDFCKNIKNADFTQEIAQKIVYVLKSYPGDTDRTQCILSGISSTLCSKNDSHIGQNLSAAGLGNALPVILSAQSTNFNTLERIFNVFHYEYCWPSERNSGCIQDLYDVIDSPDGYKGALFDILLLHMSNEKKMHRVKAHNIAYYLLHTTKCAKEIMIQKGFIEILEKTSDECYNRIRLLLKLKSKGE